MHLSQPISDESSELPPIEELLPKWKHTMLGMLRFYHPLYNSNDFNEQAEANRWHRNVKKLMIPILEGRLPTAEELELLSVNGDGVLAKHGRGREKTTDCGVAE